MELISVSTNPEATLATANGIARHVQGPVRDLIPSRDLKFIKRIPYDKENQVGSDYIEPVWLTGEHGVTFTGNAGAAVNLNGAEVAESKNAILNPTALYFQSRAVIDLLARAVSAGDRAAEAYIAAMMRNTKKGINKRCEIKTLHGGMSLATLTSATDLGPSSVFTITAATWAPGIWLGGKNMPLDAYSSTTKLNTNADLVITKVDPKNKQLTVSGNSADIDAIVAVGTSGSGVELYLKSQYGNVGYGVKRISRLVAADTFLGVTCANYADVFVATQKVWDVTATPAFTWDDLQPGVEEYVGRGGETDLIVACPPNVWTQLNSSLDALRMFDSSYSVKSVDMGHDEDAIKYHTLGISIKVEMSTFMMGGDVLAYPDPGQDSDGVRRIGATDVTFNVPGQGEDMFVRLPNTNVCEWMAYTCQDVFTTRPRDFIYWGPSF